MGFVTGWTHSQALIEMCRALGLDETKVRSFNLEVDADDSFLMVKALMYVRGSELEKLIEVIRKYELVEKKDTEEV